MNVTERDRVVYLLTSIWLTPKMQDEQLLLWKETLDPLDGPAALEAVEKCKRTCDRRPSFAKFYEHYDDPHAIDGGQQVKYFATIWRPDGSSHGETLVSPLADSTKDLQGWIDVHLAAWAADDCHVDTYRRDWRVDKDAAAVPGSLQDACLTVAPEAPEAVAKQNIAVLRTKLKEMQARNAVMTKAGPLPERGPEPAQAVAVDYRRITEPDHDEEIF